MDQEYLEIAERKDHPFIVGKTFEPLLDSRCEFPFAKVTVRDEGRQRRIDFFFGQGSFEDGMDLVNAC